MMGIFKRGSSDDKLGQWTGNGADAHPSTTAQELRMRRSPPSVPHGAPQSAPASEGEALSYNLGTLMERVSLSSVQEIDRLIAELQTLKVGLQHEAERVQREVVGFATMSQSAMQSTKIIAESLNQWRRPPEAPSADEQVAPLRSRPRRTREPLIPTAPEEPAEELPPPEAS
jgi:hypothetical protein